MTTDQPVYVSYDRNINRHSGNTGMDTALINANANYNPQIMMQPSTQEYAPNPSAKRWLPILNAVFFALTIGANGFLASGSVTPYNIGQVSRMYSSLMTPASYAFAIWGLIYSLLLAFTIWQAVPNEGGSKSLFRRNDFVIVDRVSGFFIGSGVCNIFWIGLFCQGKPAYWIMMSSVVLFTLLACLAAIQVRARLWVRAYDYPSVEGVEGASGPSGDVPPQFTPSSRQLVNDPSPGSASSVNTTSQAGANANASAAAAAAADEARTKTLSKPHNLLELVFFDLPFSIYFGWSTVAAILNIVVGLVAMGYDDQETSPLFKIVSFLSSPADYAMLILSIAAVIFLTVIFKEGNWAYGFVYTWAVLAIYSELKSNDCVLTKEDGDGSETVYRAATKEECKNVQLTCVVLAHVVAACAAIQFVVFVVKMCRRGGSRGGSSAPAPAGRASNV